MPNKIAILGYSGSGKSTLAGICAKEYDLPVLYLDTLQFLPGWAIRDREEFRQKMAEFMQNDRWVIDGNYARFFYEERMAEADRIYFLNFNRFSCLFRALKRYFTYHGEARESMAEGCPEKFDWEFFSWILWKARTPAQKQKFKWVLEQYPEKVIEIKNQKQLSKTITEITK
ncbi:MAG: DNA topology modulation protein [Clostridia bacterium]|nr:DNA topology modulation protein [Clostridia bacterium]